MSLEKELLVASVLPVVFQWSSSGFPVVSQCVPIMQINTGSPLEHHWVLASVSVVPVASQCTCGSSGLPVWSVQWYPSVLTESGLEVIRSGHFPAWNPLCIQLVWWELFELISFDLQPQIHKNYNGAHVKGIHSVMLKYSHVLRAELASITEQYTPSKGWIYRDLSTCLLVSRHLVISNWYGCYSACLTICVGACVGCHSPSSGVPVQVAKVRVSPVASQCGANSTKFLQLHSSVRLFQLSFFSGVPVCAASIRWVAQWYPNIHWVNQWHPSGIPVYTKPASVHWLRVRTCKGHYSTWLKRSHGFLKEAFKCALSITAMVGERHTVQYVHKYGTNFYTFSKCVVCIYLILLPYLFDYPFPLVRLQPHSEVNGFINPYNAGCLAWK